MSPKDDRLGHLNAARRDRRRVSNGLLMDMRPREQHVASVRQEYRQASRKEKTRCWMRCASGQGWTGRCRSGNWRMNQQRRSSGS